jgi:hypothetical protein
MSGSRTVKVLCAAAAMGAASVAVPASAGAGANPSTIVASKVVVAPGETITVSNADNEASRCEEGTVVLFTEGAPISYLYQMIVIEPDGAGDWSHEWTAPIPSEWPSQSVTGPFTFVVECNELATPAGEFSPARVAPFTYEPLTITMETSSVTTPPPTGDSTTTTTTGGAAPATAARTTPRFTG